MPARKHYEALDGLRGLAALGVLAHHLGSEAGLNWIAPEGYLAVDFFFVLSGFVLAVAYEQRLAEGEMSLGRFTWVRICRLWPMIVLANLLGAALAVTRWKLFGQPTPALIGIATLAGLVLFPVRLPMGAGVAFPLNAPHWSLLCEGLINIVYAAVARFLRTAGLIVFTALSGLAVGVLAIQGRGLDHGFVLTEWPYALARVAFSFAAGVLIHRLKPSITAPTTLLALVLALVLAAPIPALGGVSDLVFVLFVFPLLVAAGVHGGGGKASRFAGWLSYPVYAIQSPIIALCSNVIRNRHLHGVVLYLALALELASVLVAAYLAARLVDEPVRKWLSRLSTSMMLPIKPSRT